MRKISSILLILLGVQSVTAQVNSSRVMEIVRQYDATMKSAQHPEGIQSIIRKGLHTEGDESFELTLTQKTPFKIRYDYTLNGVKTLIGYNGEIGWQRTQRGDEIAIRDYVLGGFDWLRQSADLNGYLLRSLAGEGGVELSLEAQEVFEERAVNVIRASDRNKINIRYYLNAISYYLERIEVLDAEGNLLDQTNFSNYRLIEGIPVAFNIKNIKKGKTVSQSSWSEVTINSTVYDFLFEKPKF
jgi:outer membrane lipoprotein-sorting protein